MPHRPCRALWVCSCLVFVACVAACASAPFKARAVYGPELEFRAVEDRDSFNEVIWSDIEQKQPVCPVAVHVPGAEFNDELMRSAKGMTDFGARLVRSEDGRPKEKGKVRVTVMTVERHGAQVSTFYHDDRLVSVVVRADRPTPVTINGKRTSLPLARGAVLELFGQPAQMIE